jgi:hypothetical protein
MPDPLVIIVGTGRCGSTLLTRLFQENPEILSLDEFWNVFLYDGYIPVREMTGKEFWQIISKADSGIDEIALAGMGPSDPYPANSGRFNHITGIPAICRVLGSLSDDPDTLYDRLAPEVVGWPKRRMAEHCEALFDKLAVTLNRHVIVERSGGSLHFLPMFREEFPKARFVYLHRDGPDCALSMSRHFAFRLAAFRGLADAVTSGRPGFPLPQELKGATAADFDGLTSPPFDKKRFFEYPIPLSFFAHVWSELTRSGVREIRKVPKDKWMILRYEDLLSEPRVELGRLLGFIGVAPRQQWLNDACDLIDSTHAGKALSELDPTALAELQVVCKPGTEAFDLLRSERSDYRVSR